jgi:hypothetical protein
MRPNAFFVSPLFVLSLVAATSVGVGCAANGAGSSSSDPPPADDTAQGDQTPKPPESTSSSSSSGGATPPADAGAKAPAEGGVTKTGDAGAADAGDPTAIASLFPAKVGHSWTFQVTSDFAQCRGTRTGQVLSAQKVDGRDAVWISSYCDGVSPSAVSVGTQSADVDVNGQYVPQIAEPVAEGAKFASISGTTTWHAEGAVTVPAGTFQNCWRAATGSTFVIYCPGAGTVHLHEDTGNGVIDAVLQSKNF